MFTLTSSSQPSVAPAAPASARRPAAIVGVTAGVVTIAACAALAGPAAAVAAGLLAGGAAAVLDVRYRRLPNPLVSLVAWAAIIATATATSPRQAAAGAVLGAVCLGGPLLVVHLVAPPAMGFGDVKLAVALGAAIGPLDPRIALVALCGATGTTAAFGLVTRRHELPLGPGLVTGALVAIATRSLWS